MLTEIKIKNQMAELMEEINGKLFGSIYEENARELAERVREISEREKIRIVIVGEWSTGKSTLVKALTGRQDIKCDSDVSTIKREVYDYNGVCIVDTPGIFSENVEEMKLALKEILEADNVLFLISNQLFTPASKKAFLRLAREKLYFEKLILVITKMDAESADGNLPEIAAEKMNQIEDELESEGVDLNCLEMFCISAKRYMDGKKFQDHGMIEQSNINNLEETITNLGTEQYSTKRKCEKELEIFSKFIEEVSKSYIAQLSDQDRRQKECDKKKITEEIRKAQEKCKRYTDEVIREFESIVLNKWKQVLGQNGENPGDEINLEYSKLITNWKAYIREEYGELYEEILTHEDMKRIESLDNFLGSYDEYTSNDKHKKNFQVNFSIKSSGKCVSNIVNWVKKEAEPVTIIEKGKWGRTKKYMSEEGGRGTSLDTRLRKIFGNKNPALAMTRTANFYKQHEMKIGIAVVGIGTLLEIKKFLEECKDEKDRAKILRGGKKYWHTVIWEKRGEMFDLIDELSDELYTMLESGFYKKNPDNIERLIEHANKEIKNIKNTIAKEMEGN